MNDKRENMFRFLEELETYRGFNRAEILESALSELMYKAQHPKEADMVDFYMTENDFRPYVTKNDNEILENQMKMIVRVYNELTKR